MSDADQTITIDMSEVGTNACRRLDTSMQALTKAIDAKVKELSPPGNKGNALLEQVRKSNPETFTTLAGNAQKNSNDHADHFFKNLAIAATTSKLYGESPHEKIDKEYDDKYSTPFTQLLKVAKELGIAEIESGGKKLPLEEFGKNVKKDIDTAKATASLLAEGHPKLEIPRGESNLSDKARGADYANAIIHCANDVRLGKPPRFETTPDININVASPTPFTASTQATLPIPRVAYAMWNKKGALNFDQVMGMEVAAPEASPDSDKVQPEETVDAQKIIRPRQASTQNAKLLAAPLNPGIISQQLVPSVMGHTLG